MMHHVSFKVVNVILVESAFIYTLTVIILTIANVVGSNLSYCAAAVSLQLAGICFDLVLTRIWNGIASEQVYSLTHSNRSEFVNQEYSIRPPRRSVSLSSRLSPLDADSVVVGASREYMTPKYGVGDDLRGRLGIPAIRTRCVSMPDLNITPNTS